MMCDKKLSDALHNMGYIEAITRFSSKSRAISSLSNEDFVGRITAIFSPYMKNISERKFIAIQGELKKVVCEIRGQKQ